jgi:hypothetical protein
MSLVLQFAFDILGRKIQAEDSLRSLTKDRVCRAVTEKPKWKHVSECSFGLPRAASCPKPWTKIQIQGFQRLLFISDCQAGCSGLIMIGVKAHFLMVGIFTATGKYCSV